MPVPRSSYALLREQHRLRNSISDLCELQSGFHQTQGDHLQQAAQVVSWAAGHLSPRSRGMHQPVLTMCMLHADGRTQAAPIPPVCSAAQPALFPVTAVAAGTLGLIPHKRRQSAPLKEVGLEMNFRIVATTNTVGGKRRPTVNLFQWGDVMPFTTKDRHATKAPGPASQQD